MVTKKVTIVNPTGLHMRPVSVFCKEAVKYKSQIFIHFKDGEYNAKSVLSVLSACVRNGDEIELVCEGSDENEALEDMINIVENGLGEEIQK